jgi:hypothetical protein
MPPKKGKKMSGRAAARLQTQESIKSSLSSSTIMARMAHRHVIAHAISSCLVMPRDLVVIIVEYAESKVAYSIVGTHLIVIIIILSAVSILIILILCDCRRRIL